MILQRYRATFDKLATSVTARRDIPGCVFCVSTADDRNYVTSAAGDYRTDSTYYIASINKLFVSALILRLWTAGPLNLQDKIARYLPHSIMTGLHRYRNRDHAQDLTLAHLLSHTSGLPCYLADRQADGKRVMSELVVGVDQPWPVEKMLETVKQMLARFAPGQMGKAHYADTNYRLLGLIIESITGDPVDKALQQLFWELDLQNTFVCAGASDRPFVPPQNKAQQIHIPRFLASTREDIISTAEDQMTFVRAFFNGFFFSKERLRDLQHWNRIFFPFHYGIGIQKFSLPRVLSPFQPVPVMIGHCGSTGSVAFYVPEKKLFITGTVNQLSKPNLAFQTMIKIVQALK